MLPKFHDYTEEEKKEIYEAVVEAFQEGTVGEDFFRQRLLELGYKPIEIDYEIERIRGYW